MAWAVIALDMATCTGYCVGDGSTIPDHGYIDLPPAVDGERGPAFSTLRAFLVRTIERWQVKGYEVVVVFEQPILPKPFLKWEGGKPRIIYPTRIETTLMLQGLAAIAEQVADEYGCDCGHVTVSEVKKEVAGFGGAEKDDLVFVARRCGLTIERNDTSDAFGGFLLGLRHYAPQWSAKWDAKVYGSRGGLL